MNTPTTNPELRALVGQTFQYRPGFPPYDPAQDDEPGKIIIGNGMNATIIEAFENWNDVEGLVMFAVLCNETGERTHLSPAEFANPEVAT